MDHSIDQAIDKIKLLVEAYERGDREAGKQAVALARIVKQELAKGIIDNNYRVSQLDRLIAQHMSGDTEEPIQ
jgi:hypothetical protein